MAKAGSEQGLRHSRNPCSGYRFNDGEDIPHTGFQAFNRLLEKYKPAYFIHGHVHANYGGKFKRSSVYGDTVVINAYEKYTIEMEKAEP